jgi:thiol-disulfide isomerase/thioredoxin
VEGRRDTLYIAGIELPRWTAVVGAVLLLIAGLVVVYAMLKMWGGRQPTYPTGMGGTPTPTPASAAYAPSRLISEYGVDSTPRLVFNCNQMRTGTWASLEESGKLPEGTERQDLINALCRITNASAFCSKSAITSVSGPVTTLSHPPCSGEEGKVMIYAFYGPTCPASSAQRPILKQLAAEFPDEIEVRFICVPLSEADKELCGLGVSEGDYNE